MDVWKLEVTTSKTQYFEATTPTHNSRSPLQEQLWLHQNDEGGGHRNFLIKAEHLIGFPQYAALQTAAASPSTSSVMPESAHSAMPAKKEKSTLRQQFWTMLHLK